MALRPSTVLPRRPGAHPADREIARLAVPAFAALVAEPVFLLADSAIVGHLGATPLAGLGIAGSVLATLVSVSIFLAYGTTGSVARLVGAGALRRALHQGIDGCWLALAIGVATALVGLPLTSTIVGWFDPSAAVAGQAETYLRISLAGVPAMLLVLAATGVLRGLQDTRTPLLIVVIGSAANVVLNLVLVYGAGLGIAGSALGTVLAQTGMALAFLTVVARAARSVGASLRPDLGGIGRAFGAGVPLIIRTVALRVVLIVATYVATGLGTDALAANQVAFTIWTFLALALDSVAIAAQALVGRALGASDVAAARSATRRMVEWGVATGVVLGVGLLLTRPVLAPLFSPDREVQALLVAALAVVAAQQPIAGWAFVLDGVLIGAGDGRYLAYASVLTTAVFLPAAWIVAQWSLGLPALWWAIALWLVARVVTLALRERGTAWAVTGAIRKR
jgi:putative MATE family efflux protein